MTSKNSIYLIIILGLCINFTIYAQEKTSVAIKTVVIDPGHGGKDPGTIKGRIYEKNIVLSVGKKFGALIKKTYPDIKVIYTRKTDVFIPLYRRAEIANQNKADLFISFHVNSAGDSRARGTETWVMGTKHSSSNLGLCQKENNVVVLEDDYSSRYEGFDPKKPESYIIFSLLQNSHLEHSLKLASLFESNYNAYGPIKKSRGIKQGSLLVLWKCTMPAILTELGFISNPYDRKMLTSNAGQDQIARSLLKSFSKYKSEYELQTDISSYNSTDNDLSDKTYHIQVLASKNNIDCSSERFKGLNIKKYKSGTYYKYYYGDFYSREEALKILPVIQRKIRDAYIVSF
ncbi:MAG: N-acetylmuramoyl-L-alanine amidase [Bacteroidales bacterium]